LALVFAVWIVIACGMLYFFRSKRWI